MMGSRFALHSHCWRTTRMDIKLTSRVTQFLALLCILNMILAGCSSSPSPVERSQDLSATSATSTYWPTEAWRTSPPEEQGMDSHKLAQMLIAIQQQHLNLHSLLVIRNGYLVSETYFGPYQQDTRHELYSCTKSFISTLIGIAVDKAYIDRTDHRIVDFFSERTFANLDRQKEDMTLEDVLTMRSGLDWQEGDPIYREMYQSPDWVKFVLDKPMALPPGSRFNYCSGCSHLLSALLQQTTGMKYSRLCRTSFVQAARHFECELGYRCRGDSHRRLGIAAYATRHGKTRLLVSPGWTVGWDSKLSLPSGWRTPRRDTQRPMATWAMGISGGHIRPWKRIPHWGAMDRRSL